MERSGDLRVEFVSEKIDYNVEEFYKEFSDTLPKVVVVNQGYFGEIASDVFDKDQVIYIKTISKQPRVIAKFETQNHLLSIPSSYPEKLCVVKHGKVGKPKLMKDILEKKKLPVTVQFPKDQKITVGSHSMSTNHIPNMELTEKFDEMYFLGNYIIDGELCDEVINIPLYLAQLRLSLAVGIKGKHDSKWVEFVAELQERSSTLEYDPTFGNPDIAEYNPNAVHSCSVYAFLEPKVYCNIISIVNRQQLTPSYENITKDESSFGGSVRSKSYAGDGSNHPDDHGNSGHNVYEPIWSASYDATAHSPVLAPKGLVSKFSLKKALKSHKHVSKPMAPIPPCSVPLQEQSSSDVPIEEKPSSISALAMSEQPDVAPPPRMPKPSFYRNPSQNPMEPKPRAPSPVVEKMEEPSPDAVGDEAKPLVGRKEVAKPPVLAKSAAIMSVVDKLQTQMAVSAKHQPPKPGTQKVVNPPCGDTKSETHPPNVNNVSPQPINLNKNSPPSPVVNRFAAQPLNVHNNAPPQPQNVNKFAPPQPQTVNKFAPPQPQNVNKIAPKPQNVYENMSLEPPVVKKGDPPPLDADKSEKHASDDDKRSETNLPAVHNVNDVGNLSIDEVSEYLKRLKLDKYIDDFRSAMIDGQLLKDVTKDMLIEEFGFRHSEVLRLLAFAQKGHLPS